MDQARLLEKKGHVEAAAGLYLKLEAFADAARVLVRLNRFADAGKALLKSLGVLSARAVNADPARRKQALSAAALLARGGETRAAGQLYRALGEPQLAEESERRAAFLPGNTIADRYRLEDILGQGGAGVVFRAIDLELGEPVAMKIFAQPTDDEQSIENFRQELKLTRQLAHPNVIRLFDIGLHCGHRFITMELLRGHDLRSELGEPLGFAKGLGYLAQACAGLQAAHDLGIIHRDVKPENLFITEQAVLKVMDFGIARQSTGAGATFGDGVAGTPQYISPEQINEFGKVGPSADLYSLGAVAYEMFTGAPPFGGSDLMQMLRAHLELAPEPPSSRNPALPPELEGILLKLLEKAPARRYASCRALAAALEPIRQRYSVEDFF